MRTRMGFVGTAVACTAMLASLVAGSGAATAVDNTFTQVSGSPNPSDTGTPFTVTGLECDRTNNIQATGTMVFTDVTTGAALGSVAMGSSSFVNCGGASVTDSEALGAGHFHIKAKYIPGGPNPVPASPAATYTETIKRPTFTDVTWAAGATIPNVHLEGAAVAAGAKVYAISGATADCTDSGNGIPNAAVDAYNTATNTFAAKAPIPNERMLDPAGVLVGGKIYVIGGGTTCAGGTVAPVDVYAPTTDSWTTLPAASNLPSVFNGAFACAAASGPKIYYFESSGIGVLDTSATPPSWTVLPANPLLSPSLYCSASTIGGQIVITGPGNGSADANSQRVLVFNPSTSTLTLSAGKTDPYAEHSSASLRGEVIVVGGDFSSTTIDLILPGLQVVRAATPLPDGRDDADGGSIVGGKMYIVGGHSPTTSTPAVLIGTPN